MKKVKLSILFVAIFINGVFPTPSTHIWAPSCDIQPFKVVHLTADFYVPTVKNDNGDFASPVTNFGFTVGVLPFEKFQAEVGFDHIAGLGGLDEYPFYFNFKFGLPENSLLNISPQVAFGMYSIGTKEDLTNFNIAYLKFAKTFGSLGKLSFGWYIGNEKLLLDENGKVDNHGILVAYEKVVSEITDKLWICLDYQGGKNSYGSFNLGFSYKFADNVSVIFGYNIYNNSLIKPTYTIQTDIDF